MVNGREILKYAFIEADKICFEQDEDSFEWIPSENFLLKMEKLLKEVRHPFWKFHVIRNRVLIIAVVITFALFGTAMSVKEVREVMSDFVISVYENICSFMSNENNKYNRDEEVERILIPGTWKFEESEQRYIDIPVTVKEKFPRYYDLNVYENLEKEINGYKLFAIKNTVTENTLIYIENISSGKLYGFSKKPGIIWGFENLYSFENINCVVMKDRYYFDILIYDEQDGDILFDLTDSRISSYYADDTENEFYYVIAGNVYNVKGDMIAEFDTIGDIENLTLTDEGVFSGIIRGKEVFTEN